jgi:hypothetical protein
MFPISVVLVVVVVAVVVVIVVVAVQSVQKFWKHKENILFTKLFAKFVQYIHALSRDMFANDNSCCFEFFRIMSAVMHWQTSSVQFYMASDFSDICSSSGEKQ